jgi:hypothetical protein
MDPFELRVKAAYEQHLGKPLNEAVVLDITGTLRQWAHFVVECSGKIPQAISTPSAGPRAVDNTTQNGQAPQERPTSIEGTPPTAPPPVHQSSMAPATAQKR